MNFHGGYDHNNLAKVIDFSVNIPPIGISEKVLRVLTEALGHLDVYPEIDGSTCKHAIASYHGISDKEVIVGNGATELIYLMARALNVKSVMVLEPTFSEYHRAFSICNAQIMTHPFEELDTVAQRLKERSIDTLMLCSPNNPTGQMVTLSWIKALFEAMDHHDFKIVMDESFIDFVDLDHTLYMQQLKAIIDVYPLLVIRSMTKSYSVPGLRIGYGIGNQALIKTLHAHKEPWSINRLALEAIPVLLEEKDHLSKLVKWCNAEKEYLSESFDGINHLQYKIGCANFYLIKVLEKGDYSLLEALLKRGIYIRPCHDFNGLEKGSYRLTIRMREDNEKLVKALEEAIYEVI